MKGNDYGSDLEFVVAVLVIGVCLLGVTHFLILQPGGRWP